MKTNWSMYKIRFLFLFCFFVNALSMQGQKRDHTIRGTLVEDQSGQPVPYANVFLHSSRTGNFISGTNSDNTGQFLIETDSIHVFLKISFIGFETTEIKDLNFKTTILDLGTIKIKQNTKGIDEVLVSAEKSSVEFKLDKRVYNVGKDISTTGMGALEVLNNVPSVSVDIEGNIRLRGSQGVQVLINGKPSIMSDEASKALGTITADMIESIEVITNPSAKYEASGTSGIINIVLKKDEKKGLNGSVSVNTGWPHNHSIGGSINNRTQKFNLFTQFGLGYRSLPRYEESLNRSKINESLVQSDGISYRNENFYNITLGSDYYLNKYNTLTLSGNFAYEIESQPSETNFELLDSNQLTLYKYKRKEVTTALNPKYTYDFQYKKQFKSHKEHVLQFAALGRYFGKDQESEFSNEYFEGKQDFVDQQTSTVFYQADQTYKLDYVNPLNKKKTIETGALYEINNVGNDYKVFNQSGGSYLEDSSLSNNFKYIQKVFGAYLTASYEGIRKGVKLGLRAENTDLNTVLTNTNERNNLNYTNLFPTAHVSYKFSKSVQWQAGYSKRIFRPRLWDLNPFMNIRNNFNIRTGNPDLLPEFAHSYELTGIFILKKISFNTGIYYLHTIDVKENVSFYDEGVTTTMPMNIGTRDKVGVELNWKYSFKKWLTANGDFNYGYFKRQGSFESRSFDFKGDQYSGRLNLKFKLKKEIDLELTGNFESAYKTVQGRNSGFAFLDAGLRKKILKSKAVINLAVRDMFASRINRSTVDQSTYYLYSNSKRGSFFSLGFSYSFGKGEVMTYSGGRHH